MNQFIVVDVLEGLCNLDCQIEFLGKIESLCLDQTIQGLAADVLYNQSAIILLFPRFNQFGAAWAIQ